jgi:hypothetical protein
MGAEIWGEDSADIDEMFGAEINVSKSESVFFCPHISACSP